MTKLAILLFVLAVAPRTAHNHFQTETLLSLRMNQTEILFAPTANMRDLCQGEQETACKDLDHNGYGEEIMRSCGGTREGTHDSQKCRHFLCLQQQLCQCLGYAGGFDPEKGQCVK